MADKAVTAPMKRRSCCSGINPAWFTFWTLFKVHPQHQDQLQFPDHALARQLSSAHAYSDAHTAVCPARIRAMLLMHDANAWHLCECSGGRWPT